jgi:RNA recognition motif-containing protein
VGVQSRKPHPGSSPAGEQRTTIMLRNLPSSFHQEQLLTLLESAGFSERFDFVYLPVDFASGACLGYAFVNLSSSEDAQLAMVRLQGWSSWQDSSCQKIMQVCWSDPHQGLSMLIDRYRNSRIMHKAVPSAYKPLTFKAGKQVAFPGPTKRLRSPL